MVIDEFRRTVTGYYGTNGRGYLPWRKDPTSYHVLVSEYMLQQTQVDRVIPKFEAFMVKFPTLERLAMAPLSAVLVAWQGLGYNRRAKYLHDAAKRIVEMGHFPTDIAELTTLPGVGENTAGAIYAYVYDRPVVYVETNIRTVFLYHFFAGKVAVSDEDIREKVKQTLPSTGIREWYAALMDYGTYLKSNGLGKISASKHYAKQSSFSGSGRQIRGAVVRLLAEGPKSYKQLKTRIPDERLTSVLAQLEQEQLVVKRRQSYALPD